MTNTLRRTKNLNLWFQPSLRIRVLKSMTAAQERLDMRSGCHATKILPVGVRGTKNVWCLSSLVIADKLEVDGALILPPLSINALF